MTFFKKIESSIQRTVFEADELLFRQLMNNGVSREKDSKFADRRLIVMIAIGLLNRTLNLEDYLLAVVGQRWRFTKNVQFGETLSVIPKLFELNEKRLIYNIEIQIISNNELVAEGDWRIMLKYKPEGEGCLNVYN